MKGILLAVCIAGLGFAQVAPSYKDLKYPPLPQVKIPVPATVTLSNGMRVFLLEDHELPLIHGLALIHTGNLFDPPEKKGLSELMAEVLRSGGTKTKTGDQIDEELENIAASVEAGMDETSASMSFSALKENGDTVLQVFKDVMTEPEFRQDKLDLAISQSRSAIARRNDDASGIPDRELMRIIYGPATPYGWQVEYEDLDHIHRDDLVKFYQRYYFPKNIMLAVYGDFKIDEMKDKLEKTFAGWNVEQPAVPKFPEVTAKPAPGIYLAEKSDVTQTFFAIGELGGTLRDKDYAALQVAANILGQGFTSRLLSQIRTKLGYAYDISASWSANWDHPGTFRIEGSTKSQSTTETLEATRVELDKMRTSEVTERELDEAKQGVLNSFVFNFDSPAKTLNRAMRYEYYGYPKDFIFQYQKAISSVTRADVLRVAKERFLPENLAIVAVGNPKEFGKPLSALGKVNVLDLTIPEPKSDKPTAKTDPAAAERGRALLKRAQQAMGGAEKLAGVKDVTESAEMTMSPAAGGMKMKQQIRWVAPSYFRQDQALPPPMGTVVAYSDGKTGWLSFPTFAPMNASVLRQAQGEIFRELVSLMLSDRDASRTVTAAGPKSVEISGADGQSVRVEFDEATGLPVRQVYKETGMGGPPSEVKETFSDWREVDGIKLPFKVLMEQNEQKVGEVTISEIKINTGIKPEDLNKKPEPAKK
ncbi:MAG TPA: pitrilysin family protein [Bryobacteraceae bacterium]|nr:pitrilysin family protein [Bryobacteraceae bacterium]